MPFDVTTLNVMLSIDVDLDVVQAQYIFLQRRGKACPFLRSLLLCAPVEDPRLRWSPSEELSWHSPRDPQGPLTYKENNHHILVGVTSRGNGTIEKPISLWTQVSMFRNWIDENMENPKFCENGPKA